jgi:hypothetical protein
VSGVEEDEAAKLRNAAGRVQRLRDCDGRWLRRERRGGGEEIRPKDGVRGQGSTRRERPGRPADECGGRDVEERAQRPLERGTRPRGALRKDGARRPRAAVRPPSARSA